MICALWLILFLHPLYAEMRTLPEGEAIAFEAIFGTSDMKKLLEIERDPAAYWEEREKALADELIPHMEFCKIYLEEARTFIRDKVSKSAHKPWFCQDPNAIADTIKSKIPESHPAYLTILTLYTALACDYLHDPERVVFTIMEEKMRCLEHIDNLLEDYLTLSDDLNARMQWVIRDHANFSIFDYLVLFSKKQYLCGATVYDKRMEFFAHPREELVPFFAGFNGPIPHDCLSHARLQHLLESHLKRYGISYQDFFDQCWNKKMLIKNNIIDLAKSALGCFVHFHELPSAASGAWSDQDPPSLVLPHSHKLSDHGFCKIVPYFTESTTNATWREEPIKPVTTLSPNDVQKVLLDLRDKYCCPAAVPLLTKMRESMSRH